jgi:hypothetical protein
MQALHAYKESSPGATQHILQNRVYDHNCKENDND